MIPDSRSATSSSKRALLVIVRAEELGLDTNRYDSWLPGVELQLETLEQVRRLAAVQMGLAPTSAEAARAIPKLANAAAPTRGTVLHAITGDTLGTTLLLRTPAGVIETWTEEHDGTLLVGVDRTARTIATTIIHLPEALGSAVEASLASATQ